MDILLIAAISLDGYIGYNSNHPATWTSKEDKKVFVKLTKDAGVIVFGSRTFQTIGRALPGRRNIVYTSHPADITAKDVELTAENPKDLVNRLAHEGERQVAICGGAAIYTLFLRSGLITDYYLTIEPVIFGSGLNLFDKRLEVNLNLVTETKLNQDTLLLHYKPDLH